MVSHSDTLVLSWQWNIQVEIFGRKLERPDSQNRNRFTIHLELSSFRKGFYSISQNISQAKGGYYITFCKAASHALFSMHHILSYGLSIQ